LRQVRLTPQPHHDVRLEKKMSQCGEHGHGAQAPLAQPNVHDIRVNDVWIRADEIAREAQYHPAENAQQALEASAQALVVRQLLREQSLQQGLLHDVAALSPDDEEAVFQQLLQREVMVPVADEVAVTHYYHANLDKFTTSPLLEVAHILVAADPRDFAERQRAREQAESLIAQCQQDLSRFGDLASIYSSCPSKTESGSLGQLAKGQTTPEFERQLFLLQEGLADSPLESRYGFHVVWVKHRINGRQRSLQDCHQQIADYLHNHAWLKGVNQYLNMLVGAADIQGFDMAGASSPLMN
jgi:peptidyl-prolyl cis-trans isomerase C